MRLLIAEDQQDLNRLIAKILEKEGYGVDACFDGQEALYYLENTEYEQLIPDLKVDKKAFFVTCDEYVTMDSGTGIVHIAPAFW